jgi:hypothetical protein
MQQLAPSQEDSFYVWWLQARKRVPKLKRRGVDVLVLLIGWRIWKERNARTFARETMRPSQLVLGDQRRGDAMGSGRVQTL